MRLRNLKALLWFLNVLITLGVIASVALFVLKPPRPSGKGIRDSLTQLEKEAAAKRRVEGPEERFLSHYRAVWEANLLAVPPKVAETPGGAAEIETPRGPSLDTMLSLIMIVGNGSTLRYKKATTDSVNNEPIKVDDTRLVRVNEKIPGIVPEAVIKEVHTSEDPAKIDVSYAGETVSLELTNRRIDLSVPSVSGAKGDPGVKVSSWAGPSGQKEPTNRVPRAFDEDATEGYERQPGSGNWMIPAAEVERVTEDASEILEQAQISSYRDRNGRPAGIRLDNLEDGSLILERGFKVGDIVQKVNGQAINSKTEFIDWVKRNSERYNRFSVDVLRRGKSRKLSFNIQQQRR